MLQDLIKLIDPGTLMKEVTTALMEQFLHGRLITFVTDVHLSFITDNTTFQFVH